MESAVPCLSYVKVVSFRILGLCHLVKEFGSTRLEVGGLLPVDDVLLGQFVKALLELREQALCLSLVGGVTELLEQRTH